MTSLTRTLEEKVPTRTVLFVSIAVILAKWIAKAIANTIYADTMLARVSSMAGIACTALTNGAFVVISITLLLYLSREKYGDLGFHRHRLLRQIGLGTLSGVLIFALDTLFHCDYRCGYPPWRHDASGAFETGLFRLFAACRNPGSRVFGDLLA